MVLKGMNSVQALESPGFLVWAVVLSGMEGICPLLGTSQLASLTQGGFGPFKGHGPDSWKRRAREGVGEKAGPGSPHPAFQPLNSGSFQSVFVSSQDRVQRSKSHLLIHT